MTQNTRKDTRAKVVSLNVRYKSATVDEFIENHSHDVSRGGVFVKTQTPFPPGTLLKFEIRLAEDQPVIQGVGRVVWKREPTQAGADKPAGMGVKFIKIDDASTQVIERLVSKDGAGSAYASEPHVPVASMPPPRKVGSSTQIAFEGVKAPSEMPRAITGASSSPSRPPQSASGEIPGASPSSASNKPQLLRKATMLGIGGSGFPPPMKSASSPPAAPSSPPAAPTTPPPAPTMVSRSVRPSEPPRPTPKTNPPPSPFSVPARTPMFGDDNQEPTVMRQTAELLQSALKEAGGSLDEIGSSDQFSQKPPAMKRDHMTSDVPTRIQDVDQILAGGIPSLAPPKVPNMEGAPPPRASLAPKTGTGRVSLSQELAKEPRKSGAGVVWGGLAILLLGGGFAGYQMGFLTRKEEPPPAASAPTPLPVPSAHASAVPSASAAAPAPSTPAVAAVPVPVPVPAPVPSTSAGSAAASAAPAINVKPVDPAKVPTAAAAVSTEAWKPPPIKPKPAESASAPSGAPTELPAPTPVATAAPTAAPTPVETSVAPTPPPLPAPTPTPAPKPTAADPTAPPPASDLK